MRKEVPEIGWGDFKVIDDARSRDPGHALRLAQQLRAVRAQSRRQAARDRVSRSGLPGEAGKLLVNLLTEDHSRADKRGRHNAADGRLWLSLVPGRRARLSAQAQRHRSRCGGKGRKAEVRGSAFQESLVMAGHSRSKNGVASARLCPGHPRLFSMWSKDVDARHKAGHDELQSLSIRGRCFSPSDRACCSRRRSGRRCRRSSSSWLRSVRAFACRSTGLSRHRPRRPRHWRCRANWSHAPCCRALFVWIGRILPRRIGLRICKTGGGPRAGAGRRARILTRRVGDAVAIARRGGGVDAGPGALRRVPRTNPGGPNAGAGRPAAPADAPPAEPPPAPPPPPPPPCSMASGDVSVSRSAKASVWSFMARPPIREPSAVRGGGS